MVYQLVLNLKWAPEIARFTTTTVLLEEIFKSVLQEVVSIQWILHSSASTAFVILIELIETRYYIYVEGFRYVRYIVCRFLRDLTNLHVWWYL
ncbi:MAG: hypothetical protein QXE77_06135 [Desulfurococcaceae archaeon]